jgi:hypothetical protein
MLSGVICAGEQTLRSLNTQAGTETILQRFLCPNLALEKARIRNEIHEHARP